MFLTCRVSGHLTQERNAQIRNHQQKHFMRSSWKFLPDPDKLQVRVFSHRLLQLVLRASVLGHNTVTLFTFLSFCLMILGVLGGFFGSPTTGKASLTLAAAVPGAVADESRMITELVLTGKKLIQKQVVGSPPPKRDISTAVPDSRNMQRMR